MEYGVHGSHTEKNIRGIQGHTNDLQLRAGVRRRRCQKYLQGIRMSGTYQDRYTSFFITTTGSTLCQLFILLREPDTSPKLLEFLHLPFIHQVRQSQCGYPPIPYSPKELVLTTFFHRNNRRHYPMKSVLH